MESILASETFGRNRSRIFVVRRSGKTAGMPVAFQGFPASNDGKKTGVDCQMFCSLV